MKRMKKGWFGLALVSLLVVTGCGSEAETGTSDQLVVAQNTDAVTLDPHATNDSRSALIMNQIYETLVIQDEDLQIQPGLAESWEVIDEYTYEFNLKDDVHFHNGELFTAHDVEFTLLRALESPNVAHIVGAIDPDGIEVINEGTIRISTTEPFAPLLSHLAHTAMSIINEEAVNAYGDAYGQNPVGTGPFIFDSWYVGDRIELIRNEDFHGELAGVERLIVRTISEASNRLIELETGQVDIALDIAPSDLGRIETIDGVSLLRQADLRTNYIGFNLQNAPFDDVRVRQAINYAIDVNLIVETILEGVGAPATGPIGPNVWGANTDLEGYEFNMERAKELLAEAGLADGFKTTLTIDDDATRVAIATVVRNQLEELGIDVEIQSMEWGAYLEHTSEGKHDMFILGWTSVTADADYGLYPLFHSSQFGAGGNRTFYQNDRVDELLTAGRTTNDPEQRKAYYFEAQELIVEDAPWVFLHVGETLVGISDDLQGFRVSPSGHHAFYKVYFE